MRRSLQIVLLLLLLCGVPAGLMPVWAATGVSVGFVPGQGPVRDVSDARRFAALLAARLDTTVSVRLFDSPVVLQQWLSRYRELDFGWLDEAFLRTLPAGDVLPVATADNLAGTPLSGRLVARQGVDAVLLQKMYAALFAFGSAADEAAFLAELKLARFGAAGGPLAEDRAATPPPSTTAGPSAIHPSPVAPSLPPVLPVLPVLPVPAEPAEPVLPAEPAAVKPSVPSAVPAPTEQPVTLAADQLDYDGQAGMVRASGAVELRQGDMTLAADRLAWQDSTRDVAAEGEVRLSEPGAEFAGDSLSANLATGQGLAREGRVFLRERNFHLAGDEIERLGETTYRVAGGTFTTCDGDLPDWRFTADQVDVTLGRYATARNVWFEIRNRPLVYLPYLLFPVKSERESGFLLPRAGYSSRKGGILSLAWYEVIDRHLDATVYLDALSRIGIGKGLEYRYALQGDTLGEALLYHVTGVNDNDDTFALKWAHSGELPGRIRLSTDIDYAEDIDYFENFGNSAEDYNRDHTVSTVMLQRNWDDLNLTLLTEYIRDLDGDDDVIPQRLPEVNLSLSLHRLGDSPFYLQAENVLTNFVRQEGVDGQRLYVRPEVSLPLMPGRWLELTPKIALHGRFYQVDDTDDGRDRDDYDDESVVAEYALTASARFERVFPFARGGYDRLKHSIEPRVTYAYIPEGAQEKLPYFDVYDEIGETNRIEYALVNRLTGRAVDASGNRSYRELLNLRLSQLYNIDAARDDGPDDADEFSDLRVELQALPTPESTLTVEAWIPFHGDQRFSRLSASAGYTGRHGDTASFDYVYARDEDDVTPSDYLGLTLGTALLAPVHLNLEERYDFRDDRSLESLLNIEYREKCWSLFLTLSRRSSADDRPDESEIMVGFALSGLGRVGGYGSGRSTPVR